MPTAPSCSHAEPMRGIAADEGCAFGLRYMSEGIPEQRQATWAPGEGSAFLVCFGGNHEGLAWERRLCRLGFPFLHVQDSRNRWYLDGADGTVGIWDTVRKIERFRARFPGLPLVTLGQSSGGYAALRYGLILGAEVMVAFAPQTHFLVPRPIYREQASLRPPADLFDIRPDLNQTDRSVVLVVGSSEIDNPPQQFFLDDEAHLDGIVERDNVRIIRTEHTSHTVARALGESGELDLFILDQIGLIGKRGSSSSFLGRLITKAAFQILGMRKPRW